MVTEVIAQSLDELIKHNVRALLRRFHLNRDWIIGLVGERGSGKSLGGANIALRDFMMNGEPCWSNMQIKMQVDVADQAAVSYGIKGGSVIYEARHIDKQAFLALDSQYEGGCLFFDEFNLEYGEARRSSANVNLMTDRAIQQLRKMQCGLVYTVLSEMYVDTRIRENTDIFIRCSDVAFNPLNLQGRMEQGIVFEWLLYAMSTKFAGNGMTYADTKKPIGPIKMQLKHVWDAIDTMERQAAGMTKYTETKSLIPLHLPEDPVVVQNRDKWGWLDERLTKFYENHATDGDFIEILSNDFRAELGVPKDQWGFVTAKLYDKLPDMESKGKGNRSSPKIFTLPNKVLVR